MELQEFLDENTQFRFLKWTEIILQEDQATKLDSMYILVKDNKYCDVVFVDGLGNKRKVGSASKELIEKDFPLLDLSNLTEENIADWQNKLGALDGTAATIEVRDVYTIDPSESARIVNAGDENAAVLDFYIPKGDKGDQGEKGDPGGISVINFTVDNEMHLIMELETNTDLDFTIDNNGHLILTN